MVLIIHENADLIVKVINNGEPVNITSRTCTSAFWELAQKFPDELLVWSEKDLQSEILTANFSKIFHHDLIMASFSVKTQYLPESIGYVDHLPFVRVNRKVQYPTWMMSSDIGGVKGRVVLRFKNELAKIKNFRFLLNSLAKLGQQNGLFCYSTPDLMTKKNESLEVVGSVADLFKFVYVHYSSPWYFILFLCFTIYEKTIPLAAFLQFGKTKKVFQKEVDLTGINVFSHIDRNLKTIDVIIPTMGRPEHLVQVVRDLADQSFLPQKVIVVEQNPDLNTKTELAVLESIQWPFKIEHEFIHQSGVCNARNLALSKTTADLIFFCDDDNRLTRNVLRDSVLQIERYGLDVLVTAYLQPKEQTIFKKVKQWGTFGSGNAIATKKSLDGIQFSPEFEHGYGEDVDYGIQLRNAGFDIIYHPSIKITHLKAPMGGFRGDPQPISEKVKYKPSPTVMALVLKHFTPQQVRGFKISYFLKFYKYRTSKNPFIYFRQMNSHWKISKARANELLSRSKFDEDL